MTLVTIDPGKHIIGIAMWRDDRLIRAAVVGRKRGNTLTSSVHLAEDVRTWIWGDKQARNDGVDELVIERMVMRRDKPAAWDRLTTLSHVTGAIAGLVRAEKSTTVAPSVWTRNRPKPVNHRVVRAELGPDELDIVERACAQARAENAKEILDACGIGLWALNRWR